VIPRVILDTRPLFDLLLSRFWSEQGRPIDENRLACRKQFNVSPEQLSRFLGMCRGSSLFPVYLSKSAGSLGTSSDAHRDNREGYP